MPFCLPFEILFVSLLGWIFTICYVSLKYVCQCYEVHLIYHMLYYTTGNSGDHLSLRCKIHYEVDDITKVGNPLVDIELEGDDSEVNEFTTSSGYLPEDLIIVNNNSRFPVGAKYLLTCAVYF